MPCGELSIEARRCQRVTWKIQKFSQLSRKEGYYIESPVFGFAGPRRFRLYTNVNGGMVSVYMPNTKAVSYNLMFQSSSGEEIDMYRPLPTERHSELADSFIVSRIELEENRGRYVPKDIFTLICYLVKKSNAGNSKSEEEDREPGVVNLQSDYRQLLKEGTDSDTFLEVSGKEFRAHRCVLRARSPVFDAMFAHQTAEKESGRVVINDLDPDCFVHFLEYLYTGVVAANLLDKHALGLYKTADKYGVLSLKSDCVEHMSRTLSVDSFYDVSSLAQLHREENLLLLTAKFFKQNMRRIIATPKWRQFMTDNSKFANGLFMKALLPGEWLLSNYVFNT